MRLEMIQRRGRYLLFQLRMTAIWLFLSAVILPGAQVYGADLTWTGAVDTDWNTADNWSPAAVPTATDSVTIAATMQEPVFTGEGTIAGVTITTGTLTVDGSLTSSTLTQRGGTLTGNGILTARTIVWGGGTMSGSGSTVLASGGAMAVVDGNAKHTLDSRTLINNGAIGLTSGDYIFSLHEQNNGKIINNGIFDFRGNEYNQGISHTTGTVGSFTNNGILRKTSGVGTSFMHIAFNNNGTVQVDIGTLNFKPGGNSPGIDSATAVYNVTAGATLRFTLGSNTKKFDSDAISGAGTVDFFNGTSDFGNNDVTFTSTVVSQSGGVITGNGTLTAQILNWSGGTMNGSGTTVIPPGGTMTVGYAGNYPCLDGHTLRNEGAIVFSGNAARINEQNNGRIVNNGVFDFQGNQGVYHDSGDVGSFINNGTLKKSSGTGNSYIELIFNNNDTVQVDSGVLNFRPSGGNPGADSATAAYKIEDTATLRFSLGSGTKSFADGVSFAGAGTVDFFSGTSDFGGGNINFISLVQSGGVITGNGVLTIDSFGWAGGTMGGSGTTIIPTGGSMAVTTNYHYLDGRTLVNNGAVAISGSFSSIYENNNGQIVNHGTFDFQGDQDIVHDAGSVGVFINNGILKKSFGTGITQIGLTFTNNGTVQVDKGILQPLSTLINAASGRMQGSATINLTGATYTNAGATQPGSAGPGRLTIAGNYPLPSGSSLAIRLGGKTAGTGYDQLAVSGNVTLGGTLNVSLVNSFIPADGNSFTLVTSAGTTGITGTFSKLNLPALPAGKEWNIDIGKTAVVLTVEMNDDPVVSVSPLTHDFGSVFLDAGSAAKTFTLSNSGTANLIVNALAFSGTNADLFTLSPGTCGALPATLTPGQSCTVDVTFTPTAAVVAEAALTVTSNNQPLDVPLAGTGLYKLTATNVGGHGSITGPTGAALDAEAVFTIIPNSGYRIGTLTDNGKAATPVAGQTAGTFTYTLTGISAHHVIAVTFVASVALPGDCDGDGKVSIAEVQAAINMYLGLMPVSACVDVDAGSGNVSIAEVQKVINGYLGL